MEKLFFKCTRTQLKILLYGLIHLRRSCSLPDVFLSSDAVNDFNNLVDEIVQDLNFSDIDKKFYLSFLFKHEDDQD